MSLSVAAWNLHGELGNPERAPYLANDIVRLDADVLVLGHSDTGALAEGAADKLISEGYHDIHRVPYDETGYREEYTHGERDALIVASRLALHHANVVRQGVRNGFMFDVFDPATNIPIQGVGTHFDDRSIVNRNAQAQAIIDKVTHEEPAFVAGDLNIMHPQTRASRALASRTFNRIGQLPMPARPRILAARLGGMTNDEALQVFAGAGFKDADMKHQPTMPARLPLFQLDRILANEQVQTSNFNVHPRGNFSDHRAISVRLHT